MLSHESRWLRLGGIALIVFAMGLFAYLEDTVDLRRLLQPGDRSPFAQVALLFFATVNVFALGLVLLLAGLRELSLRTDVQARRGALARMGAANLMLFCFAVVGLEESGTLEDIYSTWYILPLLLAFVVVARVSILWFRSGWKYEALTAEEAMNQDRRPPVLYLRSFHVDDQILVNTGSRARNLADHVHYTASVSPEQEMAFIMEGLGPLIAIGKPGEPLPELGAARLYVGNDEWRATVARLMTDAALVVIRAGETANLWWEIEEAMTRCSPERVVILALGPPGSLPTFERRFAAVFGTPIAPPPVQRSRLLTIALRLLIPYGRSGGTIIYFDRHRVPYEEVLWYRLTWSGAVLSPYRPYRDTLQAAFRAVFATLGIRCVPRRHLATAVLLALFGGMLGLHHFYLGYKRRGLWYLAFCWLAVPIVLGWIDAVRLALLNEEQFQSRVAVPATSSAPRAH